MKTDKIDSIDIFYQDNLHGTEYKQIFVTDESEFKNIVKIFKNMKFRKKVFSEIPSFSNKTGRIMITVNTKKKLMFPIQIYSDGTIYDGSTQYHIGLIGNKDSKELFVDLLEYINNQ